MSYLIPVIRKIMKQSNAMSYKNITSGHVYGHRDEIWREDWYSVSYFFCLWVNVDVTDADRNVRRKLSGK
jgi:hypothetical protein